MSALRMFPDGRPRVSVAAAGLVLAGVLLLTGCGADESIDSADPAGSSAVPTTTVADSSTTASSTSTSSTTTTSATATSTTATSTSTSSSTSTTAAGSNPEPLSVAQAIEVDDDDDLHRVRGMVVLADGRPWLCTEVTFDAGTGRPVCGEPAIVLAGGPTSNLDALFGDLLVSDGGTTYTTEPILVTGAVLTVGPEPELWIVDGSTAGEVTS